MKHLMHLEVNQFETMAEALNEMTKMGYKYSFKLKDGKAICLETGDEFTAQEMTIVEFHRFEGDSDPSDMAVVYVVENDKNINGCLVDAYGTYADSDMSLFLENVNIGEKE